MSAFESVMWELERDPQLSSAFANLTTLDVAPDRAVLRARMERTCAAVPRLRQRVVEPPGGFAAPEWQDDPDFDDDIRFDEDSDGGGGGEGAPAAAPAGVQHACCGEKRPNTFFIFCLCTGVNVHNEACALGPLIN
jgi:hypothetical protein